MPKYTKEGFIEEAKKVHGDKYDYSKIEFINNSTKVCIVCPEHGEFWQTPRKHLKGQGCRQCGYARNAQNQALGGSIFINKAIEVHGNKYDYNKVDYINNETKICIICPEHGEFWQTPNSHLNGRGCKKCGVFQRSSQQRSNTEEFVHKVKLIHGDKYDYSKVDYITSKKNVTIICPKHGEFQQTPTHHLSGEGCSKCRYENNALKQMHDIEYVLDKFKEVHSSKYNYDKVEYTGVDNKVCIICPEHGEFWQEPWVHMKGCGCPKCGSTLSKNEDELLNILREWLGNNVVQDRVRSLFGERKEFDIVIPTHKLCIEYNGLFWHSDKFEKNDMNYHLNKTQICENNDYQLIHIFEDEYINNKNLVLSKLKHVLDIPSFCEKINVESCTIKEINDEDAFVFLNKNHIQEYATADLHLGLFNSSDLVGVMSFQKEKNAINEWELTRFATDYTKYIPNGDSKLFDFFIKSQHPKKVKSFADRRWYTDKKQNVFKHLGFNLTNIVPPDYDYFDSKSGQVKRMSKFNCSKEILHKNFGLPLTMTEHEMTRYLKYYRVYNCGYLKYMWEASEI